MPIRIVHTADNHIGLPFKQYPADVANRLIEERFAALERLVTEAGGWQAYVPYAATYPIAVTLAPRAQVPDLTALDDAGRDDLAVLLVDVLSRLDRLYDRPLPYMMWFHQRPTDGGEWPSAWLHLEIVSPWRSAGTARYIAAAEVACEEYFNPVVPEALAEQLRGLG